MALTIAVAMLDLVRSARGTDALFLGAFDIHDRIWVVPTGPRLFHGHAGWLRTQPDIIARRGFAFSFHRGNVSFHSWSGLNAAEEGYNLEPGIEAEIVALLDLASEGNLMIYRH